MEETDYFAGEFVARLPESGPQPAELNVIVSGDKVRFLLSFSNYKRTGSIALVEVQ